MEIPPEKITENKPDILIFYSWVNINESKALHKTELLTDHHSLKADYFDANY